MPKVLTSADILAAQDIPREAVEVPEWGGTVYVRAMDGQTLSRWENELVAGGGSAARVDLSNAYARLAVRTVCDEDGQLLFSERQVDELGRKNGKILQTLAQVALRLSGLTPDANAQLAKN